MMVPEGLINQAQAYLHKLCVEIGERPVGSAGNRAATAFFAQTLHDLSLNVERSAFKCMDWHDEGANLRAGEASFAVFASPYSRGVRARAPLVAVDSVEMLAKTDIRDKVLLLHGEIAREPLMPKNFPFFNPDNHRQIVALLEEGAPQAIVCATGRNADMAGGRYPFPFIEDGDFEIPSLFMTDLEGERLLAHVGQTVELESRAWREATQAENVIGRKGKRERHVLVCAHIDTKAGTPGAIDNGGGVVVLLLLAQLLAQHHADPGIEIIAFNGEDYYSAPGQQLYLAQNSGGLADIKLAMNIDGVGYHQGKTAYSLYGCDDEQARRIRVIMQRHEGLVEGPQWYQGDHTMFIQQGVPALALISERVWELTTNFTHTSNDTVEIVDAARLTTAAQALFAVALEMAQASTQSGRTGYAATPAR